MQKILVIIIATIIGVVAGMFIKAQYVTAPASTVSEVQPVEVSSEEHTHTDAETHTHNEIESATQTIGKNDTDLSTAIENNTVTSSYLGSYTLTDATFGTDVEVVVANGVRTMQSNALANHAVGEFPRTGNPNTISAQSNTYEFTLDPVYTGQAQFAREPGIALNGVKFEPQTAERLTCASGETYSIEAIQDMLNLGLDFNNAHVQPTGAYHYHGVADNLVEVFDEGVDPVLVGFAKDGHLMYYSKSGAYKSSYQLSTTYRTGTNCTYSTPSLQIDEDLAGTKPDGTYVSDWEYVEADWDGIGDAYILDECNGVSVDGEYAYFITDEYPYIPRCLMGEFEESAPGGGAGGPQPGGTPPQGQGGQRPDGPPPRQ